MYMCTLKCEQKKGSRNVKHEYRIQILILTYKLSRFMVHSKLGFAQVIY